MCGVRPAALATHRVPPIWVTVVIRVRDPCRLLLHRGRCMTPTVPLVPPRPSVRRRVVIGAVMVRCVVRCVVRCPPLRAIGRNSMPRTAIVVVSRLDADPPPRSCPCAVRRRLILSDVVRRSNRRRAPSVRRDPVPCAAIVVVVRCVRRVMMLLCIRMLLPVLVCATAMPTAVLPILALRCPGVPRLPRSCRAMMRVVVVTLMRVVVVVKVVGFGVLPMPPPVI